MMRFAFARKLMWVWLVVLMTGCTYDLDTISLVLETGQVVEGQTVYLQTCATCHGENAEGNANELAAPALDETGHAWHHPDQQIYDWIVNGKLGMGSQMPALGEELSDEEVFAVIDYLHTLWTPQQLADQQSITERYPVTIEPRDIP